jgi:hypothetical protein
MDQLCALLRTSLSFQKAVAQIRVLWVGTVGCSEPANFEMLNCQFRSAAPSARCRPVRDATGKICRLSARNACHKADVCNWC